MKKFFSLFSLLSLVAAALVSFAACKGQTAASQRNNAGTRAVALPVALADTRTDTPVLAAAGVAAIADGAPVIEIKEKMFIAQTNDVYLNPEEYLGKTIKLEGLFKSIQYEDAEDSYCFVIRYGPGCCGNDSSAGFEVAWKGEEPYPRDDDWVEASGVLDSYEENGYPYLYLALSSLTVKETRGAEFVSQ
jgi:uncharacterized membrane protein YcgQ (UPF0703/DUF1980 family)